MESEISCTSPKRPAKSSEQKIKEMETNFEVSLKFTKELKEDLDEKQLYPGESTTIFEIYT